MLGGIVACQAETVLCIVQLVVIAALDATGSTLNVTLLHAVHNR